MRCRDAYTWMLTAEDPAGTPPDDVRRHLRACARCRQRQRRLRRLGDEVRRLPAPAENPRVRERFLESFRGRPAPFRPALWPRRRILLAAAASLLVASLALWGFWPSPRPHDGTSGDLQATAAPRPAPGGRALLARVLRRDLHLARAGGPLDQVQALTGMAADLGAAALQQARHSAQGDLPLLANLYERVLRQGVAVRSRVLPPERRAEQLQPIRTQLERAESQNQRAALDIPEAAEPLRQMALAARETARALAHPTPAPVPAAPPAVPAPAASLLEEAVAQGLRLAAESDPLRRAQSCVAMADDLARTIVRDAPVAANDEMQQLGSCLGGFTGPAVETNLRRVDAAHRAEADRIRQKAARATASLEQHLDRVPRRARAALTLALDAARHAHGKPSADGKGWVAPDELEPTPARPREES